MATRSRLSIPDLRSSLLAVYRPDTPFVVRDGRPEGIDLVAELRFGDEEWHQVFREVNLRTAYTIQLRFDEAKHEVRKKERLREIGWRDGQHFYKRFGGDGNEIGEATQTITGATYERKGLFKFEKIKEFRYKTEDMREPLVRAIYRAGWESRNLIFRKL